MQKGFAQPILVLLIVLLVGIGGFFAFKYAVPNHVDKACAPGKLSTSEDPCIQDETAGWKTFTKTGFYEYRYPQDWIAVEEQSNGGSNVFKDWNKQPDGLMRITSGFNEASCTKYEEDFRNYGWKTQKETKISFSGFPAILFEGQALINKVGELEKLAEAKAIVVTKGNSCYIFSYHSYQDTKQKEILDQIISTFRFLD